MKHVPIQDTELVKVFERLSDVVWDVVRKWNGLATETVGKQWIRAADSVGANLVEGDGRYGDGDAVRFFTIARASARESRYWMRRAHARSLVSDDQAASMLAMIESGTRQLNGLIRYRRENKDVGMVREGGPEYEF